MQAASGQAAASLQTGRGDEAAQRCPAERQRRCYASMEKVRTAAAATRAPAEKPSRSAEKKEEEFGAARDQVISFNASSSARRSSGAERVSIDRLRQVTMGAKLLLRQLSATPHEQ